MSDSNIMLKGIEYRLLFTRRDILNRVEELAQKIVNDFQGSAPPILLWVLTGGAYAGVDFSRALDSLGFLHSVDTIGLKSYEADEKGGLVQIISAPHAQLGGRKIIVIEDLVDRGFTLNFLDLYLKGLEVPPESIEYCTLFLKDSHDQLNFKINYLGWTIGPGWVVGNGSDSDQHSRGLLGLYVKI